MSEETRRAVEQHGLACAECGKVEYDYDSFEQHWFHVIIPHRDVEKMESVTFCMPCGDFCSIGCFSGFGDRLVRLRLFGTDKIPMLAPRER